MTDGQFTTLIIMAMYFVFTILLIDVCTPFNLRKAIIVACAILIGITYFGFIINLCENNAVLNTFSLSNIISAPCLISIFSCLIWSVVSIGLFKILFKFWPVIKQYLK